MQSPDNGVALFEKLLAKARAQVAAGRASPRSIPTAAPEQYTEFFIPEALVVRWWETRCSHCGATQSGVEGIYERRRNRFRPTTKITRRLTSLVDLDDSLPREREWHSEVIPACHECYEDFGFAEPLAEPASTPVLLLESTNEEEPTDAEAEGADEDEDARCAEGGNAGEVPALDP